jgi:hypothetical protein
MCGTATRIMRQKTVRSTQLELYKVVTMHALTRGGANLTVDQTKGKLSQMKCGTYVRQLIALC